MAESLKPSWLDWSSQAVTSQSEAEPFYVYTSGIKDLKIKYRTFEPAAAIITSPVTVDGNVINVSLSTAEQLTDTSAIEYSVCFTESPVQEDWIPILPNGNRLIERELLFPLDARRFMPLRFQADPSTLVIRRGQSVIPPAHYNMTADGIVFREAVDLRETFVASYAAADSIDPNKIVIPERYRKIVDYRENGQLGQTFPNGTDIHGSVYLAKTPYIESSENANYSPVRVNLYGKINISTGGSVFGTTNPLTPIKDFSEDNGAIPMLRNRTDYASGQAVQLKAYDPTWENSIMKYPVFEYLHEGRRLVFTETFNNFQNYANNAISHGNGKLVVYYKHMNVTFRARIVLRNLYPQNNTTTPVLEKYTLVFGVQNGGA